MANLTSEVVQKIEGGLMCNLPKLQPHAVFVLSYSGGGLKTFTKKPSMPERMSSKFCYIVDTSEHQTHGSLHIPAMGDVYVFQVDYDATWQVTDPEVVIRRNISDFASTVTGFLRDALWRVGRSYSPNAVQSAEDEARRYLQAPFELGGGLTVTWLSIRLVLDERQSAPAVEVDTEAHVGRLTGSRVQRLRALLDGEESYLMLHLAQHPEDTGSVLQMLAAARTRNEDIRLGLLDRMLERGFIQDADIGPLRDNVLGGTGPIALSPGQPTIPVITPAQVRVVQPTVPDVDPNRTDDKDNEVGTASTSPSAPGNVTNWKPVQRGKPYRGAR